jgi:plastocyanin domain-containing protein
MNARKTVALLFALPVVVVLTAARLSAVQAPRPAEKKMQTVRLTFDDTGYVVTPPSVTRGVPVRMEVDLQTVKGCMRTVVIDAVGVKKTVKAGETTIEFTPTKSGKIEIVCGMNMGRGSFTVVEPK